MNALQKTRFNLFIAKIKEVECNANGRGRRSGARTTCREAFEKAYKRGAYTPDINVRDFLDDVHPLLALRYAFDWSKDPDRSATFWANINKKWVDECFKTNDGHKIAFVEGLSLYSQDELKVELASLFSEGQIVEGMTHHEVIEYLINYKTEQLANEDAIRRKKEQEEREAIERAAEEGRRKEAEAANERLRQLKAQEEADRVRNQNNIWGRSEVVVNTPEPVDDDADDFAVEVNDAPDVSSSDIFSSISDFGDFLKPKYPKPLDFEFTVKTVDGENVIEFGNAISRAIAASKHRILKVITVHKDESRWITFCSDGKVKANVPRAITKSNVTISSEWACNGFMKMFKKSGFFIGTLSANQSQNPDYVAFKIESVRNK